MPNDTRPSSNSLEFPIEDKLFPDPIRSDFGDFVRKAVDFFHRRPKIGERIVADQRASALEKKHKRARFRNDELARNLSLFGEEVDLTACSLELETGRPRMHPLVVFVFVLLRGRLGGPCRADFQDLVRESRSLEAAFPPYARSLPAPTTILENLNVLSDSTLEYIHHLQLAEALDDGLEDFARLAVDSTAVEAASAWPTDSKTIVDLCDRFLSTESKLESFGFAAASRLKCEDWLGRLASLHKTISMSGGGEAGSKKRRSAYRDFFIVACKLLERLLERHAGQLRWIQSACLAPFAGERAGLLLQVLGEDVFAAATTLHHGISRVEEGCPPKTAERILGVADRAAAIIVKGGREPVMGYKPQLARSGNGLITAVIVESGNPADSANLEPLVSWSIAATSVVPVEVTADDGYASAAGLDAVKACGVRRVSISGAKGKRLLQEQWDLPEMVELRRWRSSVESLMFVLKHGYRFGRLGRRGLQAVRRELLEKALAYNFDRLILLRKRQQPTTAPPKAA